MDEFQGIIIPTTILLLLLIPLITRLSLTRVKLIALYNSQNPAIAEGARAAQQAERRVIRNQNLIGF